MAPAAEFDESDTPTRPDLPATAARLCRHCGRAYGEHAQGVKPTGPHACGGLRRDYAPEDRSAADAER